MVLAISNCGERQPKLQTTLERDCIKSWKGRHMRFKKDKRRGLRPNNNGGRRNPAPVARMKLIGRKTTAPPKTNVKGNKRGKDVGGSPIGNVELCLRTRWVLIVLWGIMGKFKSSPSTRGSEVLGT